MNHKDKNLCAECAKEYATSYIHQYDALVLPEGKCGVCGKKGKILRFKKGYLNT